MRLKERLNRLEAAIDRKAREFSHPAQDTLPFDDMPPEFLSLFEKEGFIDARWRASRVWAFLKHAREEAAQCLH